MSLSRSSSAVLTFVHILSFATTSYAQATCGESVRAALGTITSNLAGLNFPCCQTSQARCRLSDADCEGSFPDFASCISASGSVACGMTESGSTGAPCAAYQGTVGPYGVSPVGSGGLEFDLDGIVAANWPRLGLDDSVVLCCRAGNGACHLGELVDDDINPCNVRNEEYELFCVGDARHGMCTVRANTRQTREIGQYFRINLDPAARPSSSGPSSASNTPSSTQTSPNADGTTSDGPPKSSQGAPVSSSGSRTNLGLAVALPVVLAVLLLATCALLFRRRLRKFALKSRELPLEERITPMYTPTNVFFPAESHLPSEGHTNVTGPVGGKGSDVYSRSHTRRTSSRGYGSSTYVNGSTFVNVGRSDGPRPPSYSEHER